LETFLGVRIVKQHDCLYLSQPGHILKIAKVAEVDSSYPHVSTPMLAVYDEKVQRDSPRCDEGKYRKLLGMLI
jgi:hypothetical protein